jgi:hypothetical protein
MPRVRVVKNTQVNIGGVLHEGGATIDVTDEEAAGLLASRLVEPVKAAAKAKQMAKTDVENKAVKARRAP